MSNFDFHQAGADKQAFQNFSDQTNDRPLVDMVNASDLNQVFGKNSAHQSSVVSDSGQLIFDDPYKSQGTNWNSDNWNGHGGGHGHAREQAHGHDHDRHINTAQVQSDQPNQPVQSSEQSPTGGGDSVAAAAPPATDATAAAAPPATDSTTAAATAPASTTDNTTAVATTGDAGVNPLQPSGQGVVDGVLFGIDGHPDWSDTSYANLTPQQQADAVKAMGLGIYQGDIYSGDTAGTQAILTATQKDGLQFLGSMGADPSTFANATDAYNQSFQEAATEGQDFGSQIKLFQLGNEMDTWATASPQNMQIAEAELKGLTDGLKSTDPSAETMINTTNGPTGIQFLQQLQSDGINWDVTGFHSYTQNGDVADSGTGTTLASVASLGKPIYVNEFNGWSSGDQGPSALAGNAELMTNSMNSILSVAKQYDIIGANAYELLDQPENGNSPESQFGVLTNTGGQTATSQAITSWMNANGQTSA